VRSWVYTSAGQFHEEVRLSLIEVSSFHVYKDDGSYCLIPRLLLVVN